MTPKESGKKEEAELQMRWFGCECGKCRYFVPVGIVAIEPNASAARLHQILKAQNWISDDAVCERASCGHRTFVARESTILGGKARG